MNFKVIDGDRDYLKLADEYARLYNNHKIPVKEIQERMNLSQNKFNKESNYASTQL